MPTPEVIQVLSDLQGTHEGANVLSLLSVYSPRDSFNVYVDEKGRITKVLGYESLNTAYTTDTGADATKVVNLFDYLDGSTHEIIGIFDDGTDEYEIAVSTDLGQSFTFKKDLGNGPLGNIATAAQFDSDLFIAVGSGVPQKYDGSTVSNAGATQSPTPTVSAAATTGTLSGNYRYKLVSVESDGTRSPGSDESDDVQLEDEQADLSWTADSNTEVAGYDVYRTTGTGGVFRFVQYVDGRTTTSFTDNLSDRRLRAQPVLDNHGEPPPTGAYHVEVWKGRTWWGRTDSEPQRLWYSDPLKPESVGVNNNLDLIDEADGISDRIVGMTGGFQDSIVVWQERSIWRVSGDGRVIGDQINWTPVKTPAQIGTVSHRSVVRIPPGARYVRDDGEIITTTNVTLAFFSSLMDIRLFDGLGDTVISQPKQDTLDTVLYAQRDLIHARHDPDRKIVEWFVPTSGAFTSGRSILWNYGNGTFSERRNTNFLCSLKTFDSSNAVLLLAGEANTSTGGLVYKDWSGNDLNGVGNDIEAQFFTKPLYAPGEEAPVPSSKARWRWIEPVFTGIGSAQSITIRWYVGYKSDGDTPHGSLTLDMDGGGDTHVQSAERLKSSSGDNPLGQQIVVEFRDDADDAAWSLLGFMLGVQVLRGKRLAS